MIVKNFFYEKYYLLFIFNELILIVILNFLSGKSTVFDIEREVGVFVVSIYFFYFNNKIGEFYFF